MISTIKLQITISTKSNKQNGFHGNVNRMKKKKEEKRNFYQKVNNAVPVL